MRARSLEIQFVYQFVDLLALITSRLFVASTVYRSISSLTRPPPMIVFCNPYERTGDCRSLQPDLQKEEDLAVIAAISPSLVCSCVLNSKS